MARPRAIQGEVEKALLNALTDCPNIAIACASVGIDPSVYYDEVKRNAEFAEKAHRARTRKAIRAMANIHTAGKQDWRASQAWLQLAFPEQYSRQRLEVSGPGGGPIATVHAEVPPEFFAAARRLLDEAVAESAPASPAEPLHP